MIYRICFLYQIILSMLYVLANAGVCSRSHTHSCIASFAPKVEQKVEVNGVNKKAQERAQMKLDKLIASKAVAPDGSHKPQIKFSIWPTITRNTVGSAEDGDVERRGRLRVLKCMNGRTIPVISQARMCLRYWKMARKPRMPLKAFMRNKKIEET